MIAPSTASTGCGATTSTSLSANAGLGGGTTDIYTSAVQFEVFGAGTSSAVKVALAAVVGILAVGLILLGVSVSTKRRAGGTTEKTKVTGGKETAKVK